MRSRIDDERDREHIVRSWGNSRGDPEASELLWLDLRQSNQSGAIAQICEIFTSSFGRTSIPGKAK